MSSCSVYQQYLKPEVKLPEQWQAPLPHSGNLNTLVDWWGQFNDPVLSQLLTAAEKDNPTLDTALANIKSARANVMSARAGAFPGVTGNASHIRSGGDSGFGSGGVATSNAGAGAGTSQGFPTGSSGGVTDSTRATLDASWEIDLFGAIRFSRQAADATLQARQSDWHEARVTLAAEVTNNYLDYRTCQLLVGAYQRQLDSKKETSRLTAIQEGAGFASPADAALAEASANSTLSSLVGQQAQCEITIKQLVALTGLDEPKVREMLVTGEAAIPRPAEFDIQVLPVSVINQRPDLIAKERALAAASANVGVAEANRYPSLSLTGSIGVSVISVEGNKFNSHPWSFGPALSIPIFDAGKLKAEKTDAEAQYDLAFANYRQNVRTAVSEVEQALVNLDTANKREAAEQKSTAQYRKFFTATEINWRAGGASLLTLEDARRQAINAELAWINQQHDRVASWIALYKAIGGGWDIAPDETAQGPAVTEEKQ